MIQKLKKYFNNKINSFLKKRFVLLCPDLVTTSLSNQFTDVPIHFFKNNFSNGFIGEYSKLYSQYFLKSCKIGNHTYIAYNSKIHMTTIGNFCSIGPNFVCGHGIHPTNGISTSPEFYSTLKQTGHTFSETSKFEEIKPINIGNDVFIGMNVCVLDGVTIHDGAMIGAGAVVIKDIPPYAIAVGVPAKVVKYRFDEKTIQKLLKIKWWNWDEDKLKEVEKYCFDIETFVNKYDKEA